MASRFSRDRGRDDSGAVATRERETAPRERAGRPGREPDTRPATRDAHAERRAEFGGFSWGSDFFGWLTAAGLGAILTAIAAAAGATLALNQTGDTVTGGQAETIGIGGGIALLVILGIAYFCGGYVAGRMARFDGARQGVGVWLWGIIIAVALAVLAAIGGSEYNVLEQLNLPRIPIDSGDLATGGAIALAAALAVTLIAAILGGKTGERFHDKVDRVGTHR
jgi:hypothetical protein